MNLFPSRETVSTSGQIHFWSRGKIPYSAFLRIRKHQTDKNKEFEESMLAEWII
jgi:hypothetical protein